jgi:hypothetical protein
MVHPFFTGMDEYAAFTGMDEYAAPRRRTAPQDDGAIRRPAELQL